MRNEIVDRLLSINREFYCRFAESFSSSRSQPNPGYYKLLEHLPVGFHSLLDVGCGDGRLGRFLDEHVTIGHYVGVDFSEELLALAEASVPGIFRKIDLADEDPLRDIGRFDVVAALAVLQHIPSKVRRINLLRSAATCLNTGGRIFVSTWQFLTSPRQKRKIVDWNEIGMDPAELEGNDYLLSWQRDGHGVRYVNYIDAAAIADLSSAAGLRVIEQFRCDGREGNLNLYSILEVVDQR